MYCSQYFPDSLGCWIGGEQIDFNVTYIPPNEFLLGPGMCLLSMYGESGTFA